MRLEQQRLTENCGENVNALCMGMESTHDIKQCLAMNYASLDTDCAEYLISDSGDGDDDDRKHGHIAKGLFMILGFTLLVVLACACRRRCKRRRQMWREMMMQRNLTGPTQEPRYVAVPTQTVPVNAQVQQAQLVPMPTAPQQIQPQQPTMAQGVIYTASPYTGGIPVSAVPVAYNPQAMSFA